MPAWLSFVFVKFVLPLLLQEAIKAGIMTDVQAAAITSYEDFVAWFKTIKTYSKPEDFPSQDSKGQAF